MREIHPFRTAPYRACLLDVASCVAGRTYGDVRLPGYIKDLLFSRAYWVRLWDGTDRLVISALWDEPIRDYADRAARMLADRGIAFEEFVTPVARMTPSDTPEFSEIVRTHHAMYPGIPVFPYLQGSSYSEASLFRERGLHCYGIVTVTLNGASSIAFGADTSLFLCTPQQVCMSYSVSDPNGMAKLTEVLTAGFGTLDSANNAVCFTPTTAGTYEFILSVTDSCGVVDMDTVSATITFGEFAAITCPSGPILASLCGAGQVCQTLAIAHAGATVTTTLGTYSGGQLCFNADTTGTYTARVIASSTCGADTCDITFLVTVGQAAQLSLEEILSHLTVAHELNYISEVLYRELMNDGDEIDRMLNGYIAYLKKSKQGANEPGANYHPNEESPSKTSESSEDLWEPENPVLKSSILYSLQIRSKL